MNELLNGIENQIKKKINDIIIEKQEELISLENTQSKTSFLKKWNLEHEIENKRLELRKLERFIEEVVVLLAKINQYFYLKRPIFEEKEYLYDIILTKKELNLKIKAYPEVLEYLMHLEKFLELPKEEIILCIKDNSETRKRNIHLDLKRNLTFYPNLSYELKEKTDSQLEAVVDSYLGSNYPTFKSDIQISSYRYIGEINKEAISNHWNFKEYSTATDTFLFQKELESIQKWREFDEWKNPITKEVLLLSKQKILSILFRLRKLKSVEPNLNQLEMENYLANILVAITSELLGTTPQTLK